jgi:hypothetical protein
MRATIVPAFESTAVTVTDVAARSGAGAWGLDPLVTDENESARRPATPPPVRACSAALDGVMAGS